MGSPGRHTRTQGPLLGLVLPARHRVPHQTWHRWAVPVLVGVAILAVITVLLVVSDAALA